MVLLLYTFHTVGGRAGTGENFFKVLEGFYEDIKMEWAEHGNKIEEFEIKGPKIVIILDNASIHKKKEFLEK